MIMETTDPAATDLAGHPFIAPSAIRAGDRIAAHDDRDPHGVRSTVHDVIGVRADTTWPGPGTLLTVIIDGGTLSILDTDGTGRRSPSARYTRR